MLRLAMTIRKGEPWGEPAVCPADLRVVSDDRELRDWVIWHRTRDQPIRDLGVAGGDLARTCGGGTDAHPSAAKVTVDAMRITLDDGEPTWGVAHVVARGSWLRGEVAMVMNAQFYLLYDVAPRSHPNDGKVDVVRVDPAMSWRERLQARQRARTGTHLPHRHLAFQSRAEVDLSFEKSLIVLVDGVYIGSARRLQVTVEPDAFTAYV
jgi:YegS C-terminal NAD kinase beta sandwich-like domain